MAQTRFSSVIQALERARDWRAAAGALERGELAEFRGVKSAAAAWRQAARSEATAARVFGAYLQGWAADRDARRNAPPPDPAPPRERKRLGRPPAGVVIRRKR